jgi:hypothetical protein
MSYERTRLYRLNRANSQMVDNPEVIQFMVDGMSNERSSQVVPKLAGKESSGALWGCRSAVTQRFLLAGRVPSLPPGMIGLQITMPDPPALPSRHCGC